MELDPGKIPQTLLCCTNFTHFSSYPSLTRPKISCNLNTFFSPGPLIPIPQGLNMCFDTHNFKLLYHTSTVPKVHLPPPTTTIFSRILKQTAIRILKHSSQKLVILCLSKLTKDFTNSTHCLYLPLSLHH